MASSTRSTAGSPVKMHAPSTGAALEKVVERLKDHKLTIRNVPMDAAPVDGACIFTGEPAVERVLLAKAY